MSDAQLALWATIISSTVAVVGFLMAVIIPLSKKIKNLTRSADRFADDWFGQEASPGRDAIPGVMARINAIDGELKHNGGSTMKDALKRVEIAAADRTETLGRIEIALTAMDGKMGSMDDKIVAGNQHLTALDDRLTALENERKN